MLDAPPPPDHSVDPIGSPQPAPVRDRALPTAEPNTRDNPGDLDDAAFPLDAFPEPVRAWIRDTATAAQVSPDAIAFPFLAIAGATIGAIHALRVAPGWIERPTLWIALVGEVGTGKTPAITAVRRPIDVLQQRAWNESSAISRQSEARPRDPYESDDVDWLVTESARIETLIAELQSSVGLIIIRDELIGLVNSMEGARGRRGDARQKFLTLWSAAPLYSAHPPSYPRAGMPVVGILGGVQPHVYARLRSRDGDGFLERFLPIVLDASTRYWREPSVVTAGAATAVQDVVTERLAAIREVFPGPDGEGWVIDRDRAARAVWTAWYNDNVDRTRAVPELTAGFYRKLPAHTARIALILHVLHYPDDAHQHPLGPSVMHDATRLAERLRRHIHRVIPCLGTSTADVAPPPKLTLPQRVHRLLAETDVPDGWVDRTAIWERLLRPDRDELTAALDSLVADRIAVARAITRPGSRKPARQWRLAP